MDMSTGGETGKACKTTGFAVRYVIAADPGENPTASLTFEEGMEKCTASAKGYYVRSVDSLMEVNCIYESKTDINTSEYGTTDPDLGMEYTVDPAIYAWTLPTTGAPHAVPPTGMNVDSVHFEPSCAESGCWVIKGVVTTGEAFNSFGAFNTFFLPQTNIKFSDVYDATQCDVSFDRAGTGMCWIIGDAKADYSTAQTQCASLGGRPVTLHSTMENRQLLDMLTRSAGLNSGKVWIGYNDIVTEGDFVWEGDANSSYTNWDSGEPNDSRNSEDCTETSITGNGKWNDQGCSDNNYYVCEIESPTAWPDPSSSLSYDFDYGHVEWTFAPAKHPCTSATYDAGTDNTDKISTCCITNPGIGEDGGFVSNYRPTQSFVDWAGSLMCDLEFDRNGSAVCWKLYEEKVDFATVEARCSAAGGRPITLKSQAENDLLQENLCNYYTTSFSSNCNVDVWLGMTDEAQEDEWVWRADGAALDWTNWKDGQPNNSGGNEQCATLDKNGEWWDRGCTQKYRLACEFDPPVFDRSCVKHVVQRPGYTAPTGEEDVPCWNVKTESKKFWEAEADCVTLGGHLATIEDNEENWFMWRFLDFKGVGGNIWIGYTDNSTEDTWRWLSDSESGYTNWNNGEPNNNRGAEHVVEFATSNAGWNDQSETDRNRYVCQLPRTAGVTCDSDDLKNLDPPFDITFPSNRASFLHAGKFKGMTASPGIVSLVNTDPFFGQFDFEIKLDEVELRSKAGKLKGTVNVEHTVDTYLGLANFRPTGGAVLDTFATQTALHMEKTSFFTVSTHGTNEYTFLEYVNMRLVSILWEDTDFSGDSESASRTVRTDSSANVNYVQVTFTLGEKYSVNNFPNDDKYTSGLIPLDSVRVGRGTFLETTTMEQTCSTFARGTDSTDVALSYAGIAVTKKDFTDAVAQDCAPQATMCASPAEVPDQFVSFNIPLGSEVFDGQAANDLSNNIFVDFVINAIDDDAREEDVTSPNGGQAPWQVKTTLSASIPIVAGGINIFCDGITAKTDLKDVADADIIVGSAASEDELTRLRIVENIASTSLDAVSSTQIDTASIESALMTLVLKGNSSYFYSGASNTMGYSLELDDLITIHLMEDGEATTTNSKEATLKTLLAQLPDDNSDANGLNTDGYFLNGAFKFDIARDDGIAKLEPSSALMAICPFNPPRPAAGSSELESCITRRDVQTRRYPKRNGAAQPTAMEILAQKGTLSSDDLQDEIETLDEQKGNTCGCSVGTSCCEAAFLQGILGENDYARDLAVDFVKAIHERYTLNGRYTRAYWINPGYEWTPTQTAGKSIFQVSQKVYLFALITLDENWSRRRMLLSTDPTKDSGSGLGAANMQYSTSPKSMMAGVFQVPEDKVALFDVEMQLTSAEACMSRVEQQTAFQATFQDYLITTASAWHTVQVVGITVDMGDEKCGSRRNIRKLLSGFSSATASVRMLIVFEDGDKPIINTKALSELPGISAVKAEASTASAVTMDDTFVCVGDKCDGARGVDAKDKAKAASDDSDDSSNTALIAGIAGGVGGALLVVAGAVLFMRSKSSGGNVHVAHPVQTIDVGSLKAQLHEEV